MRDPSRSGAAPDAPAEPSRLSLFKPYDTLTRSQRGLRPLQDDVVTVYTCGPTVYNDQHIGNYRTFVFEDVLVKTLRRLGAAVKRVMNITDVGHLTSDADEGEDKLEVGARREGTTAWDVARRYEDRFLEDLDALHIERPQHLVRATETIQRQIELIKDLEAKGYTYVTSDGVYFDSAKVPDYGKLARLDREGLLAGARVEVGEKRHPTDFALWKFSPRDRRRDMEWDSPWGKGFPGWHIECSAIIAETLGESIDIHCGGVDHIPVHHTNEIAQSESATGRPLAQVWMHGDFLLVDGGKMAKSLGNVYTLEDIRRRGIDPLALRLLFYSASYRSKLNFTWEGLEGAAHSLQTLRRAYREGGAGGTVPPGERAAFDLALADDLNLPAAMAVVWGVVRGDYAPADKRAFLADADTVLSLDLDKEEDAVPAAVQALVRQREAARTAKDWQEADRLRTEIEAQGFAVRDTPEGPETERR